MLPDTGAIREIGIEWCIKQSRELIKWGAPVLHYIFQTAGQITSAGIIEKVF